MDFQIMRNGPLFYYSDSVVDLSGYRNNLSGADITNALCIRVGHGTIDLSEPRTAEFNYGFMNRDGQRKKWSFGCWFKKTTEGFIAGRTQNGFWAGTNYVRAKIGSAIVDCPISDWSQALFLFINYVDGQIIFHVNGIPIGQAENTTVLSADNTFTIVRGLVSDVVGFNKIIAPESIMEMYKNGIAATNYREQIMLRNPNVYWSFDFEPSYVYEEKTTDQFLTGININTLVADDMITLENYQDYEATEAPVFDNGLVLQTGELIIQL